MKKTKRIELPTFAERLDSAVMAAFPGVECHTELSIWTMQMVSHWYVAGSDGEKKLTPAKARRVKDFVMGFSACEGSHQ